MLIGLDGLSLNELRTGVGHYTFELARALAENSPSDSFELVSPRQFLRPPDSGVLGQEEEWPENLRAIWAKTGALDKHWWVVGLPKYIKRNSIELFHGTNYEAPLRRICPVVLTIHDLSLLLLPYTHEKRRVIRSRFRLSLMTRASTMIIAPTESVRKEIRENLDLPLERIAAIPEAPRSGFKRMPAYESIGIKRRLGVEDDFLLFVGTVEPRKDLLTLVRAFEEIHRTSSRTLQLVIAGKKGWLNSDLFEYIAKSSIGDRIKFTGYVPDHTLCALYSSCLVFIYPSLYEGFGLPVLEAMACGAPVIASSIPSLVEVAGVAARLFPPGNFRELASRIKTLLDDRRAHRHFSSAGLTRAANFSWSRTAELTRNVYVEALERFTIQQRH